MLGKGSICLPTLVSLCITSLISDDDNLYCDGYTRLIPLKTVEENKLAMYNLDQKQLNVTIHQLLQININLLDDFKDCKKGHLCRISGKFYIPSCQELFTF